MLLCQVKLHKSFLRIGLMLDLLACKLRLLFIICLGARRNLLDHSAKASVIRVSTSHHLFHELSGKVSVVHTVFVAKRGIINIVVVVGVHGDRYFAFLLS